MNDSSTKLPAVLTTAATILAVSFSSSLLAAASWKNGDRIFGQSNDGYWYPGKITSIHAKGYNVKYDANSNVVNALKVAAYSWRTGSQLQCTMEGAGSRYFSGKILTTEAYSVFRIRFDNGHTQYRRSSSCRFSGTPYIAVSKPIVQYSPPPPGGNNRKFNPGEAVLAYHSGFWYPATITAVRTQDYSIKFSGGLVSNHQESYLSRIVWGQGSRVQCDSKTDSGQTYYNAQVEAINNRDIWVIYNNGVRENFTHGYCRSK
ncbi:MAG: hypothetical protein OFPI_12340 [Osedax symbiont Rs2]|nr:MAG: hypothetical protein OFPI_12340 [Osedax symbiont Rs2]